MSLRVTVKGKGNGPVNAFITYLHSKGWNNMFIVHTDNKQTVTFLRIGKLGVLVGIALIGLGMLTACTHTAVKNVSIIGGTLVQEKCNYKTVGVYVPVNFEGACNTEVIGTIK